MTGSPSAAPLGIVAVGRNEGERLERCLRSALARATHVVYVDSGSVDGSVALARSLGVTALELDASRPFSAARARNAGLRALPPSAELVQFVDGDCELIDGWLERGTARLRERPELAAVSGRVRERYPDRSIYHRSCDVEWDTPVGDALACGGNALMRRAAFEEAGGFREDLVAGEEPELCLRLRRRGWRIERLADDMVWHDAAITRFSQWWRRSVRAGHANAEGAYNHGASPDHYRVRECGRALLWGAVVPALAVGGALPTLGASLTLLGGYPVTALRVYRDVRRRGRSPGDAASAGLLTTLGKFAELEGMAKFAWRTAFGQPRTLIEYKGPAR